MAEIDLVCPWVDGSDPAWRAERDRYASALERKQTVMWRDWGLMRYWFRGVERALPWVHRIYFVTWGHLPPWLNEAHPKLRVVRHTDYIPEAYLPTFSSSTIGLNAHRIPGLSEQFIYTNDDCFFLDYMEKEAFFQNGLPCDYLHIRPITELCANGFGHILWNDLACLNEHFSLAACMEKNAAHWFHPSYPEKNRRDNEMARRLTRFPGFANPHLPQPMLRSTYEEVWEKARDRLHCACKERFRSSSDCNEWLMRDWQLAAGRFTPYMREGVGVEINGAKETIRDALLSTRNRVVCLNEGSGNVDFVSRRAYLQSLFERGLPEKSAFEKE